MASLRTALRRIAVTSPRVTRAAAISSSRMATVSSMPAAHQFSVVRGFATTIHPGKEFPRVKWAQNPIVEYDELKPITRQPNDDILLVDVREPDEVALGSIPSSVNLPLSRLDEVLGEEYNDGAFKQEFAFPKPTPSQKIIFSCRSGKRSATACELANKHGYLNTRNYVGSMLEWAEKEGLNPVALGL